MSGFDWFLVAFWIVGAVLVVSNINKPRSPNTPQIAAFVPAINLGLIAGLLRSRGVL